MAPSSFLPSSIYRRDWQVSDGCLSPPPETGGTTYERDPSDHAGPGYFQTVWRSAGTEVCFNRCRTPCTVHGIIGPNGAGQDHSLQHHHRNHYPRTRERSVLKGPRSCQANAARLVRLGVARTFQNIRLFKNMTVMDNVMIGQQVHTPTPILSILTFGPESPGGARMQPEAKRWRLSHSSAWKGRRRETGEKPAVWAATPGRVRSCAGSQTTILLLWTNRRQE